MECTLRQVWQSDLDTVSNIFFRNTENAVQAVY